MPLLCSHRGLFKKEKKKGGKKTFFYCALVRARSATLRNRDGGTPDPDGNCFKAPVASRRRPPVFFSPPCRIEPVQPHGPPQRSDVPGTDGRSSRITHEPPAANEPELRPSGEEETGGGAL